MCKHIKDSVKDVPSIPSSWQKVYVRRVSLSNYRNYSFLQQNFFGGRVVLTGCNGAGKTNLLEAVSLLSPGRGLRRASYSDMPTVNNEENGIIGGSFAVSAVLQSSLYGEVQIGTALAGIGSSDNENMDGKGIEVSGRPAANKRRIIINGAARSADSLSEYCRILWIVPAQDGLFSGAAAPRRDFLDRMVLALDSVHARRVADYEKLMRSRNRLLAGENADSVWLTAIEAQMAALGTAIAAARQELIARLMSIAAPFLLPKIFPQAKLSAQGLLETMLQERSALDVEDFYGKLLLENREKDRAAGRCLAGPHRSDMGVFHVDKNLPAALCSTGEQKALLTGIILSHACLTAEFSSITPILLLDEIAAHLDSQRREALFTVLDNLGAQAFMTGTDKSLFASLKGRAEFFSVRDGVLEIDD